MIRLEAQLPRDRECPGWIELYRDGTRLAGPYRARGEADNTAAAKASNVQEDPERSFGDHPFGLYRVTRVVWGPAPRASYGGAFLALDPVDGEALEAKRNGRTGLGIHGGDRDGAKRLRATHGCLRVDEGAITALAQAVDEELTAGRAVFYRCREQEASAEDITA